MAILIIITVTVCLTVLFIGFVRLIVNTVLTHKKRKKRRENEEALATEN